MYHSDETRFYQTDDSKVKGSQEQSFFLQTLLFTAFLATVQKVITYALVST